MPARSFLSEIRDGVRHFYATDLRHEVSDADIQGYLRAATQIEDIWQQIEDGITGRIAGGEPPWSAYSRYGYALAFVRIARTCQIFVRELIAADAAFSPETTGYLPRVTYDQANALCHEIQPNLRRAVAALNDQAYQPDVALPMVLGPRVEAEGTCPVAHLQGMINAASEVREWAAGLTAQFDNAVAHATMHVPAEVTAHIAALQSRLAQADSSLRFGTDLVGQITEGQATPELHEQAEDNLWEALRGLFLLNQAVALPELLKVGAVSAIQNSSHAPRSRVYHDKHVRPHDLWRIAAPSARTELRGTEFGTDEMREMCEKMGGILSAGAQQYLDDVERATARDDAYIIAAMANCPFEPLYRARRQLDIAGATIPAGYEFHWDFHRGHIESAPRFGRVKEWQECAE